MAGAGDDNAAGTTDDSETNAGSAEELQRKIRKVAYLMWEAAGSQHGRALEFWLAAESELLSTRESGRERIKSGLRENTDPPKTQRPEPDLSAGD